MTPRLSLRTVALEQRVGRDADGTAFPESPKPAKVRRRIESGPARPALRAVRKQASDRLRVASDDDLSRRGKLALRLGPLVTNVSHGHARHGPMSNMFHVRSPSAPVATLSARLDGRPRVTDLDEVLASAQKLHRARPTRGKDPPKFAIAHVSAGQPEDLWWCASTFLKLHEVVVLCEDYGSGRCAPSQRAPHPRLWPTLDRIRESPEPDRDHQSNEWQPAGICASTQTRSGRLGSVTYAASVGWSRRRAA